MVDLMNAFNACSLNYVAIQGKLIQAALLLLRALSHINVYDTDGQNAVENHLVNNMFVNKKLLVIAGETRKPVGFMQSCCFVFNGNQTKTCVLCNSYLFGMNNVLYIEQVCLEDKM